MEKQDYFWLAGCIAVGAAAAVFWVRKRVRLHHARTWPVAPGRVESIAIGLESTGPDTSVYVARVNYSYTVQGVAYAGVLKRQFMLKNPGNTWLGRYANGRALTIRYNSDKPKDSVLFEKEQPAGP
jgi:hypothetical protein